MHPLSAFRVGICAVLASASVEASAQTTPVLDPVALAVAIDSGLVANDKSSRGTIYTAIVRAPDAPWIRLRFDAAVLGSPPDGGRPTVLRVTSLADGAVQHLDTVGLALWGNTSAYFNGEAVAVELVADPGAAPSRVAISTVLAGAPGPGGIASICGPTDDRTRSTDDRVGRLPSAGCTAWLFSDAGSCMLTAGHCVVAGLEVVEFNVPLSDATGAIQHPGPEDQYAVDVSSIQFAYGADGNDWAYFGCFVNTETGLTALEAQNAFHVLADPPPPGGQTIRITGYGLDDSPLDWSQVQQTHAGPYADLTEYAVQYEVDTRAGNSGSPVVDEQTGLAIGIHTSEGCDEFGGANLGTGVNNPGFQFALSNPQGACVPQTPIGFIFPEGLPQDIDPAGEIVRVEVFGQNGGTPQPGTGMLHYDIGQGFVGVPMQVVSPDVYDAVFPVVDCGTPIEYFFSAEATTAEVVTEPLFAPQFHFDGIAAASMTAGFLDDFETDQGWTVENGVGLTDGQWERGVPVNSVRGDPPTDADGSGQCFVTANQNGNSDVDEGSTTLVSPVMDASGSLPVISYWRWFSNSHGPNPFTEPFVVEVSDAGGQSWIELETVGPAGPEVNGTWFYVELAIGDYVALTNQFRIRFTATDPDPRSIVEAGVDGVKLSNIGCVQGPPSDLNGDGIVDIADFLILLGVWGPCADPCPPFCLGDIDGDCTAGVTDFLLMLGEWTS
ncbi:MAG: trypsin-like peptidase domain-containing protein [Planctomycetota bacterium]|jgi:V8-like Glu-specific endopeptidase